MVSLYGKIQGYVLLLQGIEIANWSKKNMIPGRFLKQELPESLQGRLASTPLYHDAWIYGNVTNKEGRSCTYIYGSQYFILELRFSGLMEPEIRFLLSALEAVQKLQDSRVTIFVSRNITILDPEGEGFEANEITLNL